jgi:hypothetical protein
MTAQEDKTTVVVNGRRLAFTKAYQQMDKDILAFLLYDYAPLPPQELTDLYCKWHFFTHCKKFTCEE